MRWIFSYLVFSIVVGLPFSVHGQIPISGTDCLLFEIRGESENIEFIAAGADTSQIKPALIFLQGSQPVPLIIDADEHKHVVLPFDYKEVAKDFHLFVIAMPHTPVEAALNQLNNQYCFVPDSSRSPGFDENYLRNNTLENYTHRTSQVIYEILELGWVEDNVHLVGHSQGAKIAAVVAAENESVSTAALLAFNAFGRYDEKIRKDRHALRTGIINGEEYQQRIEDHYGRWQHIQQNPDDFGSGNNAWVSFSVDYLPYLLKTEIPLWVGFGTEDISAENCDLLPLHFISAGKDNLWLEAYPGWDHNFFDSEGTMHWDEVMRDVTAWMEKDKRSE